MVGATLIRALHDVFLDGVSRGVLLAILSIRQPYDSRVREEHLKKCLSKVLIEIYASEDQSASHQ